MDRDPIIAAADEGLVPAHKGWRVWRWLGWFFATFFILLIIALAIIWWQRVPIATSVVDDQLKKLGLPARYTIEQIGPQTQIIRDIRIGPAERPDLIVKQAIVEMRWGWDGPYPVSVQTSGVRLRGDYRDGKLSFGALDKLRDPNSKEPFRLPDIIANLRDTQISLTTEYGPIGAAIEGEGVLRTQFTGKLALASRTLSGGGCTTSGLALSGSFVLAYGAPEFEGPVRAQSLNCASLKLSSGPIESASIIKSSANFQTWSVTNSLTAKDARYSGNALTLVTGSIDAKGTQSQLDVDYDLRGTSLRTAQANAVSVDATGDVQLDWSAPTLAWSGGADIRAKRASLAPTILSAVAAQQQRNGSLPFDPIIERTTKAIMAAGRAFDVEFPLRFEGAGNKGRLLIAELDATSASGASFSLSGGKGLAIALPSGQLALSSTMIVRGGGLPSIEAMVLRDPRTNSLSGRAVFAPYAAGASRVAIDPLTFSTLPDGGVRFATALNFTGPIPGGSIEQADIPLVGTYGRDGSVQLAGGCTTISFVALNISGTRAGANSLPLCATLGQPLIRYGAAGLVGKASIPNLQWRGAIGASPLRVTARSANIDFATLGFSGEGVAVQLGDASAPIKFDIERISGASSGKGAFKGQVAGAAGQIGAVPLYLSGIQANWTYANSTLDMQGQMRFEDAEQVDRFLPMQSNDFVLNYAGDSITASGSVTEPTTGRTVAGVKIAHSLRGNSGNADLSINDLRFDEKFQPVLLTRKVLGVVADVRGAVNGTGQIRWNGGRVASDGRFRTNDMGLFAAFGPVAGVDGEIIFSDLLAFETAPGQIVKVASINTGLEVVNGVIRYQLLPEQQVAVEGGNWEFAGGQLLLLPTVLDFSAEKPRRFLFTVRGVDAELFLYRFGYENITATGVFDGELPMVFDQAGGRIEGGALQTRAGGGTIAYNGELSNRDLGMMANFAFDALKSLKYDSLSINMNGDLGGELVTDVKFSGISQGTGARRNFLTKQIAKLPFEFNISIKAPFRQLLDSGRRYYDPSIDAQANVNQLILEEEKRKNQQNPGKMPTAPAVPLSPTPTPAPAPPPMPVPSKEAPALPPAPITAVLKTEPDVQPSVSDRNP